MFEFGVPGPNFDSENFGFFSPNNQLNVLDFAKLLDSTNFSHTKMMNRMNINNTALRRRTQLFLISVLYLSPLLTMAKAATFSTAKNNYFDYG